MAKKSKSRDLVLTDEKRKEIKKWCDDDYSSPKPNPDGVPCHILNCPLNVLWKEHPDWMYVPWETKQVNPYCRDANCPFYEEAMK